MTSATAQFGRESGRDTTVSAALRIWALLFGMAAMLAGNGLQSSLLGLRAEAEAFGGTVTGLGWGTVQLDTSETL